MRHFLLCVLLLAAVPSVEAAARRKVQVPLNVGLGPSAFLLSGPVFRDQPVHFGLKLDMYALIDQQTIRQNLDKVPRQYRRYAQGVRELRLSSLFIPDSLIISPKVQRTGVYGITFRPIAASVPVFDGPVSLRLSAGLLLTYMFLHSDVLPTTHFLRPGLDIRAALEWMLTESFGLTFGWSSGFYIPQELGGFGLAPVGQALWHFGQGYLVFNFRIPYQTSF